MKLGENGPELVNLPPFQNPQRIGVYEASTSSSIRRTSSPFDILNGYEAV